MTARERATLREAVAEQWRQSTAFRREWERYERWGVAARHEYATRDRRKIR